MTQHLRSRTVIPIREAAGPWPEPTLEELLSDPIVEAMMQADSVNRERLLDMLGDVTRALQANDRSRAREPLAREQGQHVTPAHCCA
jgi:hypothetical protein